MPALPTTNGSLKAPTLEERDGMETNLAPAVLAFLRWNGQVLGHPSLARNGPGSFFVNSTMPQRD